MLNVIELSVVVAYEIYLECEKGKLDYICGEAKNDRTSKQLFLATAALNLDFSTPYYPSQRIISSDYRINIILLPEVHFSEH